MEYWHFSERDFFKLKKGEIKLWCKHCEASTWHFKKSETRDKRGYAGVSHTFYVCAVCNNISPYFDSGNAKECCMHEYKKNNVRVTCPKCKGRFFYSSKLKGSKCKKCGYFLPLNAVIEI